MTFGLGKHSAIEIQQKTGHFTQTGLTESDPIFSGIAPIVGKTPCQNLPADFQAKADDAAIQAWCRSYADSLANALAAGGSVVSGPP